MSTYGKIIEINLFGESHGSAIGIVINNLPAGIKLDLDKFDEALSKRRPKGEESTKRREQDNYEIVSGFFKGRTTGSPFTVLIRNSDTRSKDYNPNILRPSHADYTAYKKYNGFNDFRGGGHFSGRITAPLMILGAICSQILRQKGILVGSHIYSIKDLKDNYFNNDNLDIKTLRTLIQSDFPLLDASLLDDFKSIIINAKNHKDSVGGRVETAILGLDAGYGDPFFDSIESVISHLIFSIPAVKGIEFGKGFDITTKFGSEVNDEFIMENGLIKTSTNNSGGIQGGISNGMPVTFKTAIKPTASIGSKQSTIDINSKEKIELELQGRHDPCIVHRVVHVINAVTSYAILETIARKEGLSWVK